jgi:hypothetical protein
MRKISKKILSDLAHDFLDGFEAEFEEYFKEISWKESHVYVDKVCEFIDEWVKENYEFEKNYFKKEKSK